MNWQKILEWIVKTLEWFKTWHTTVAAIGLLGLALYQVSQGEFSLALQNFMAALAAFGIGKTVAESNEALLQMKKGFKDHLELQEKELKELKAKLEKK